MLPTEYQHVSTVTVSILVLAFSSKHWCSRDSQLQVVSRTMEQFPPQPLHGLFTSHQQSLYSYFAEVWIFMQNWQILSLGIQLAEPSVSDDNQQLLLPIWPLKLSLPSSNQDAEPDSRINLITRPDLTQAFDRMDVLVFETESGHSRICKEISRWTFIFNSILFI